MQCALEQSPLKEIFALNLFDYVRFVEALLYLNKGPSNLLDIQCKIPQSGLTLGALSFEKVRKVQDIYYKKKSSQAKAATFIQNGYFVQENKQTNAIKRNLPLA